MWKERKLTKKSLDLAHLNIIDSRCGFAGRFNYAKAE